MTSTQDPLTSCIRCGKPTPDDGFALRSSVSKGLVNRPWCKACDVPQKEQRSPDSARIKKMRQRYGLSLADFIKMGEAQGWMCYLCAADIKEAPYIDHDHATGRVRKLLCFHCNIALGHFFDSVETLTKATVYIQEHRMIGATLDGPASSVSEVHG